MCGLSEHEKILHAPSFACYSESQLPSPAAYSLYLRILPLAAAAAKSCLAQLPTTSDSGFLSSPPAWIESLVDTKRTGIPLLCGRRGSASLG